MTDPQTALITAVLAILFWLGLLAVLSYGLIRLFLYREHKRNRR